MRIASLELHDFVPFSDSGITRLIVDFTSSVQIIIGSNGSGKSSLLRQLSPMPTVRSMFGKTGYKSLIVEVGDTSYKLVSEYEKPSSPHAFYEGDSLDNLNIGRTTDTQKELIEEHLRITPLIDDLIMNKLVFPKMGKAQRQEFLMNTNPDQIGFIRTHAKQMAVKVKACKANLARLQSRKILLEQELLSPEVMQTLMTEKAQIDKDLGNFQQNLMDIEVGARSLTGSSGTTDISHLQSVRHSLWRMQDRLRMLSHVARKDSVRQRDREHLLAQMAVCDQQVKQADEQILAVSAELSECEVRYAEMAPGGDLKQIDETIARLESERDKFQVTAPSFDLTPEDLKVKYQECDVLQDKLQIFTQLTTPLLSTAKRQHRERMLQSAQYKQSSYRHRLSDLETQYEDLSKRHNLTPRDIPDSPCAKDKCPLYSHFMGEWQTAEQKRQSVRLSLEKGRRKIARLDVYVDGLLTFFENSKPFTDRILWLSAQAQANPILHSTLRQLDVLSVLSTNPNLISRKLREAYNQIDRWHTLKSIQSDLDAAYILKNRHISSESHDTIKLVSTIENMKKTLYELRSVITTVSDTRHSLQKQLYDIESFDNTKEAVFQIRDHHLQLIHALAHRHEKDKLKLLYTAVSALRSEHFSRLSKIEQTLREQDSIKDRYQQEVISQIGDIEKELSDLEKIYDALINIPKENMIGFINTLFGQANKLIQAVWTVPLQIDRLEPDDLLNYDFTVTGDNDSSREMSECSEGQTEIISLAINLALRIVLGHHNFPLCLDEPGRTLDSTHKQNLILLLKTLLESGIISQLILVSHHAAFHETFPNSETLVIREDNILLPANGQYNQHVTIT